MNQMKMLEKPVRGAVGFYRPDPGNGIKSPNIVLDVLEDKVSVFETPSGLVFTLGQSEWMSHSEMVAETDMLSEDPRYAAGGVASEDLDRLLKDRRFTLSQFGKALSLVSDVLANHPLRQPDTTEGKGYRVHLYAVVRVPVDVQGASSQLDAIAKAEKSVALNRDFQRGEYADDVVGVLVDENGDEAHLNTRTYVVSKENGEWVEEHPAANSKLELTPSQLTILKTYADGNFAHLADCRTQEAFRTELDQCRDTLFKFLMIETSKREDCLSHAETIDRIEGAMRDLAKVRSAVGLDSEWTLAEPEQKREIAQ